MADKKNVFSTEADRGSRAAGSVGDFFKQLNWQVVSFFPNSPCARDKKDLKDK